jgi:hypothetical protein
MDKPDELTQEQWQMHLRQQGPDADKMIFSPLGGPYPRRLPNWQYITDPDDLRETAGMTDEEAMAWMDIPWSDESK